MSETEIKKKEMINKLNELSDDCERSRVWKEKEWRLNLKVGDYIDALNYYATPLNIHDVE